MSSARRRPNSHPSGFSLLDALAATGLLGVALLGLSAGPLTLARNAKTADSLAVATALAQEELERLRSLPLGAEELAPGSVTESDDALAEGSKKKAGRFLRTVRVSKGDQPTPGLLTVTVTVSWTDTRPHTMALAAFVRCSAIPCS